MDTHPGPWLARCRIGAVVLDGQGRLFQRHAIGKSGPRLAAVDHSSPYQLQRDHFHRDLHRVYIVYDFVYSHLTKSAHHPKFLTVRPSIELRPSYYFKCKKMYQQRQTDGTDHLHRSVEGIWELALRLWAAVPAASMGTPFGNSPRRFVGNRRNYLERFWAKKSKRRLFSEARQSTGRARNSSLNIFSERSQRERSENVWVCRCWIKCEGVILI